MDVLAVTVILYETPVQTFGRIIRKVVPLPGSEERTKMRPLWYSSMIRLTRVSPRPQPRFFVVKPGLNTFRKFLRAMPLPVSETSM